MILKPNNIYKNILCLTIAVLLSFTEMQFFGEIDIFSPIFLVILGVTVPTIYLYFLPKQDTILIFIYNIVLVFILDLIDMEVNVKLFLISIFFITFLFCQSLFTENARRFKNKKAAHKIYCIILLIFLFIVSFLTFLIYEYILEPNIDDKLELSLMYEEISPEANNQIQSLFDNSSDENTGGGSGGGDLRINLLYVFLLILSILSALVVLYILYRFIRYKIWVVRTKKSSENEKIRRVYTYSLNSLALAGFQKKIHETPLEYMKSIDYDNFPFSKCDFIFLTNAFVSSYYGNNLKHQEESVKLMEFFSSISKCIRKKMGIKKYIFNYLMKIKLCD